MARKTDAVRTENYSMVLKEIFARPMQGRKEIADAVGISASSVTSIAGNLLDYLLISESERASAGQGRPRVPLSVDSESLLVMGIHLGPKVTGIVLTGLDGKAKASVLVPHAGLDAQASFALVIEQANQLIKEKANGRRILGTGVATGGIVDRINGRIIENKGAGWKQVPAVEMLSELPQPLILDNNARAAAQSELFYGHGAQESDFLLMVITSDLGAVLVSDGKIRSGSAQHAGHIAHLKVSDEEFKCECGSTGCLQVMATDEATVRRAHEAGRNDVINYGDIDRLYDAGDQQIQGLVADRDAFVAKAAAILFDLLDPGLLVIAGTPAERPETLAHVKSVVSKTAHQGAIAGTRVVYSSDHELSLSIFAASIMVNEVLADPLSFISSAKGHHQRR